MIDGCGLCWVDVGCEDARTAGDVPHADAQDKTATLINSYVFIKKTNEATLT